jgi:hypothetical protein
MTLGDALKHRSFKHYCNCGGYAYGMSMRSMSDHPHMNWCAQYSEWEEWAEALRRGGFDPHHHRREALGEGK